MRDSLVDLAQRMQQGDQRAVRPFFRQLEPEGIRYLRKHTSLSRAVAKERVNDVLTDLCCQFFKGKTLDNPRAYFFRMLRNRSFNQKEHKEYERQQRKDSLAELAEVGQEPKAPDEADRSLLRAEMIRWMHKMLDQLDPKCRSIIQKTILAHHREARQVDLTKVAEELQLKNRQTLLSSKSRCLKRIKEQYYDSYQALIFN